MTTASRILSHDSLARGEQLRQQGKPKQALAYFRKAAQDSPGPQALERLGETYLALGQYREALSCLVLSAETGRAGAFTFALRGHILRYLESWIKAARDFERAWQLNRQEDSLPWHWEWAWGIKKLPKSVMERFLKFMDRLPGLETPVRFWLKLWETDTAMRLNRKSRARRAQQAAFRALGRPEPYFLMGYFFSEMGRHPEALREFKKAARACGKPNARLLAWMGEARFYCSDSAGALRDLNRSMSLASKMERPQVISWRGMVRLFQNRPQEALPDLREAVQGIPCFATAWAWMGAAEFLTGQRRSAQKRIQHCLNLEPMNHLGRIWSVKLDLAQGKTKEAQKKLENFVNDLRLKPVSWKIFWPETVAAKTPIEISRLVERIIKKSRGRLSRISKSDALS